MAPRNPWGLRAKLPWPVFRHWHAAVISFLLTTAGFPAHGSDHYTVRQLDSLATRIGKTYWIAAVSNHTPPFLSGPAVTALPFHPQPNTSFEIIQLTGREQKDPFYKVKFDSGKEAYIKPEMFLEELNLTIATADPQADKKKKAAEAAEEEKKRIEWIQAQPWSRGIKEAAIRRQIIGGMNEAEVRKILGNPVRMTKVKAQLNVAEEHWLYADGSTVVFYNGLLNRIEPKRNVEPQPTTEQK